ncbi:aldo keto reductase family protein [Stylonychia lemnae]|uniref:Aldo keto reductase family protein n=1 Tax=Stylonychia lemnae TaxID=5949 RepID=A0A078B4B6_STYLE|nr:aldo keto reductase family protein [Stylonychia lemnae]|eukprot:CDW88343.1 aldo keto reductase family protein [Stylonychia lemnae]
MEAKDLKAQMEYRYMGNTGLKVSIVGFGNMIIQHQGNAQKTTNSIVARCLEYGINYFDTAEFYDEGNAESYLGQAFKELKVPRESVVVSTKLMFGTGSIFNVKTPPPTVVGLSRKHVIEGALRSLRKLQMEYVDIIFGSRFDQYSPLEEICRAFSWLVEKGYALYWGVSEWPIDATVEAIKLCHELNLRAPVVEQAQYSMLSRERFEKEYKPLFDKHGFGATIWSPLASGILTGRYNDGNIPNDSRFNDNPGFKHFVMSQFMNPNNKDKNVKILNDLGALAKELGYTQTQLALAWAMASKDSSSLILGFSKLSYIDENLKAIELYKKWSKEIEQRCEAILGNQPIPSMDYVIFRPNPQRREAAVFGKRPQ